MISPLLYQQHKEEKINKKGPDPDSVSRIRSSQPIRRPLHQSSSARFTSPRYIQRKTRRKYRFLIISPWHFPGILHSLVNNKSIRKVLILSPVSRIRSSEPLWRPLYQTYCARISFQRFRCPSRRSDLNNSSSFRLDSLHSLVNNKSRREVLILSPVSRIRSSERIWRALHQSSSARIVSPRYIQRQTWKKYHFVIISPRHFA